MILVISSPSSSTTGLTTFIFDMQPYSLHRAGVDARRNLTGR
jgi:hypothetical protein